jgi:hypothetical protein
MRTREMYLPSILNLNGCNMIKLTLPHSNLTSLHPQALRARATRAIRVYSFKKKAYGLIRNESR